MFFFAARGMGAMIYTFPKNVLRHCPVGSCMCIYTGESPHYIFILVSRAFAGYLRQIVRLSGFAQFQYSRKRLLPDEASAGVLVCSHTRLGEYSFIRRRVQRITVCRINRAVDTAAIRQLSDNSQLLCNDSQRSRDSSWKQREIPWRTVLIQI